MDTQFPLAPVADLPWLAYASLLVIAVYFRFSRPLTIRNLDLFLTLLIAAAVVVSTHFRDSAFWVAAAENRGSESLNPDAVAADVVLPPAQISPVAGHELVQPELIREPHPAYAWSSLALVVLAVLLVVRLLFDESLTRRPRFDQNLNAAGLTFLCIPAFAILAFGVFLKPAPMTNLKAVGTGRALLQRREVEVDRTKELSDVPAPTETLIAAGGAAVAQLSGTLPKSVSVDTGATRDIELLVARILVVVAHFVIVLGLLFIGRWHFASVQLGVAMSCLYLLLPCTAANVHKLSHVLPAACLIWAIASYRKPTVAGILLGLACGTLFFAIFLLPLWAVFYGRKGAMRFGASVLGVVIVLAACLMMISGDADSFFNRVVTSTNWTVYRLLDESLTITHTPVSHLFIRIPMAAIFFVMLTAMTALPRPRNLENLLANSTALVVSAQMWYPDDIGSYVQWYMPLFLVVVFRPRLDRFTPPDMVERQATTVVNELTTGSQSTVAISRLSLYR
ncbi:MAG: hypothetical protein KDB01_05915 [Planctomycetaceae bacterium]|nr:hypothetical protein [Planctomycetaceae bacterium]